jgi:hypothetical protein
VLKCPDLSQQLIPEYKGAFKIQNGLPVDSPLRGLLFEFGVVISVTVVRV